MNVFRDEEVLPELLAMAVWDRGWLRQAAHLVSADDFKPVPRPKGQGEDSNFWIVASIALTFFKKNRVPVGTLLGQELLKWKKEASVSTQRFEEITRFVKLIRKRYAPDRSGILVEQVFGFKQQVRRQRILREMVDLEEQGQLDEDLWLKYMREGVDPNSSKGTVSDWLSNFEERQNRRNSVAFRQIPALLIDELDGNIRAVGRGDLGLWIAGYKMGKSLAMLATSTAYLWQGYNVLYVTLEDPRSSVEDRLDASLTDLAIAELGGNVKLESRFNLVKGRLKARIKIVDGTGDKLSIAQIFEWYERLRLTGFHADAIVVDYDNEILPSVRMRDGRRFELSDIYSEFRRMLSKTDTIGWLAAQANRKSEGKKIVGGKEVSEDLGKIQKATMSIGIGQGEWGDDSRYLFVAAHKFDRCRFGFNIWSDPSKGLFYDRERTQEYRLSHNVMV